MTDAKEEAPSPDRSEILEANTLDQEIKNVQDFLQRTIEKIKELSSDMESMQADLEALRTRVNVLASRAASATATAPETKESSFEKALRIPLETLFAFSLSVRVRNLTQEYNASALEKGMPQFRYVGDWIDLDKSSGYGYIKMLELDKIFGCGKKVVRDIQKQLTKSLSFYESLTEDEIAALKAFKQARPSILPG